MGKITRYSGNVQPFAINAALNDRTTFGTTNTGDDTLDGNTTVGYLTGWGIVSPSESPTLEDFNAVGFTLGQYIAYLHQMGVAEWNGTQEYQVGSIVNRAGLKYICQTADHSGATPPESDAVNWKLDPAAGIGFDNAASGLTATTVQGALDELGKYRQEITIDFPADADFALSADQNLYGRIRLTDLGFPLTAPRVVTVSSTERQFAVINETAQSLTIKTQAGTGVSVADGAYAVLRCDGTNVVYDELNNINSFLESGYSIRGDGKIEQWGVSSLLTNNSFETVALPTAFPNGALNGQVSGYTAGVDDVADIQPKLVSITTTQIRVGMDTNGVSFRVMWRVVGW